MASKQEAARGARPGRRTLRKSGTQGTGKRAAGGPMWIYGRHAAEAVLHNPRRVIHRLVGTHNSINQLAAEAVGHPTAETLTPDKLSAMLGANAVHQGIAVLAEPLPTVELADQCDQPILLALDQVNDPQNIGAILRSAAAFGVGAVVMTERHAPTITGVLAKAASGALEHVALITITNLARGIDHLKDRGYYAIGLSEGGDVPISAAVKQHVSHAQKPHKLLLILGGEGKGLRRLTNERCDLLAHIPLAGSLKTLNVSNAAAVALYATALCLSNQQVRADP